MVDLYIQILFHQLPTSQEIHSSSYLSYSPFSSCYYYNNTFESNEHSYLIRLVNQCLENQCYQVTSDVNPNKKVDIRKKHYNKNNNRFYINNQLTRHSNELLHKNNESQLLIIYLLHEIDKNKSSTLSESQSTTQETTTESQSTNQETTIQKSKTSTKNNSSQSQNEPVIPYINLTKEVVDFIRLCYQLRNEKQFILTLTIEIDYFVLPNESCIFIYKVQSNIGVILSTCIHSTITSLITNTPQRTNIIHPILSHNYYPLLSYNSLSCILHFLQSSLPNSTKVIHYGHVSIEIQETIIESNVKQRIEKIIKSMIE